MSRLIPQTLLSNIPNLYDTEGELDPLCHVKLFTPDSNFTWYIIEISKEEKESSTCYGYVQGMESELGYFSLNELSSIRGPLGLKVERDLSFEPTLFSRIKKDEHEHR